ncbi:MAG: histidine phosphatase family protein [Ramlibacter sp.]
MKLWLVRHAAPQVDAGTCYGALDLPADPAATRQAAQALAAVLPPGMRLHHSLLQRCEQLVAALLGLRPDLTCQPDPDLAEMDFGAWEGQRWDQIGAAALQAWTDDFAHHRPGGGESVHEFMGRVARAFDTTRRAGHDTVWVTHAGVIRAVRLLCAGQRQVTEATAWPREAPAFGQWRLLTLPATRAWAAEFRG